MMIGFGCTDSASPPMSLAIELQVSLQILAAPGVVPGAMAYPRIDHTATALPTGLVLVAGGAGSRSAAGEASAELYDPATGVFAPTGAMASARHGHTATPLANGDVLMTGGIGWANSALASTEIYDASTGMFAATGSLGTARAGHSATTLANGRVLLVGGFDVSDNPLASAEIYDPTSGKFAATGSLGTARWGHAAALLGDGRVLIAGGTEYYGAANRVHLATAEIFDPASGQFTPTGAMAEARLALTATAVTGGLVLVTGGLGSNAAPLSSAELYDPATGRFAPTGSMAAARGGHTATLRADGSVLVVGGDSLYRSDPYICNGRIGCGELVLWPTERVEVFSPATGTFATSRPLSLQRAFHTATLLPSGAVLVTGGAVVAYGGYHQAFRHFITITAESAL